MPITAADKISAAQIQHYFEDATGKMFVCIFQHFKTDSNILRMLLAKRIGAEERGLSGARWKKDCTQKVWPRCQRWEVPFGSCVSCYLCLLCWLLTVALAFLRMQVFKSSKGFAFRRGCLLAMVGTTVNEGGHGTRQVFQKVCLSILDRFFDRYSSFWNVLFWVTSNLSPHFFFACTTGSFRS